MATDYRKVSFVGALRQARDTFAAAVYEHARAYVLTHPLPDGRKEFDQAEIDLLRGDHAFVVAEVLFLLREVGASDPTVLKALLDAHTDKIDTIVKDLEERTDTLQVTVGGMSPQRLAKGRLTERQIGSALSELEAYDELAFDQRVFASLFIETMSPETNRQVVLKLAAGGFLKRIGVSTVRVRSLGHLERLYNDYLTAILNAATAET